MNVSEFVAQWKTSGGAENANAQPFVRDLCDVLGVERPNPSQESEAANDYVFERSVVHDERGVRSTKRIDCYKRGCFILESKQSSTRNSRAALDANQGELLPEDAAAVRGGSARRGTPAWDRMMRRAYGQARDYVADLPADHAAPVFLIVVDVGHMIELYADFSGQGRNYTQFPNRRDFQISLKALSDDKVRERLRLVWDNPAALNPAIRSAEVTRDVAERLARVAKRLEKKHTPGEVAAFLMRCLFTIFAEDVELIPKGEFTKLLNDLKDHPDRFVPQLEHLWRTMDEGGFEPRTGATLKRFNGTLFKDRTALALDREGIHELAVAAGRDWRDVEPAIFGTLLERALDPKEREQLGAHYTPRAYVERLVVPTIIEPLREDWQAVQAAISEAVDAAGAIRATGPGADADRARELGRALRLARTFHDKLCATRVLDPACGTGNFLYVSLELMKRLEGEVLETIASLSGQDPMALTGRTVDPSQFYGLELNPRAVAIAELVLWLGYLKWQLQNTAPDQIAEPVLHAYGTIREADAVLAYDERRPRLAEDGTPLTRWDGETMKISPVTGREVPDETARVPVYDYLNPRRASWPEAEFIVGNPPFIGGGFLRQALGDGYAEALWKVRPEVPAKADLVMQWWDEAARRLTAGGAKGKPNPLRRFGFITTNSITQAFSRRVVARYLSAKVPVSLLFAIPDHPWVKGSDRAAVRIAITVAVLGRHEGICGRVVREAALDTDAPTVDLATGLGVITSKLVLGADITRSIPLLSNDAISSNGMMLAGNGFILQKDDPSLNSLRREDPSQRVIKPYMSGRDMVGRGSTSFVIDLFEEDIEFIKSHFPIAYGRVYDLVRPIRMQNNRKSFRNRWWSFGEPRKLLREFSFILERYIATVETTKHRVFQFISTGTWPDHMLIAVGLDGSSFVAALSSRIHAVWTIMSGGWLGVGNDSRYTKSRTFDPFPFPALLTDTHLEPQAKALKERLDDLGERLDAFRKVRLAEHDDLTMTGLYNRLERRREALAGGEPLTEAEREDHARAQTALLAELHDDIDRATLAAYGWDDFADALVGKPGGTTPSSHKDAAQEAAEEEMLSRLVALNQERAK